MSMTKLADFVHSVIENRPGDSKEIFNNIMSEKILYKMAEKRHQMAKTLFKDLTEEKYEIIDKDGKVIEQGIECKDSDEAKKCLADKQAKDKKNTYKNCSIKKVK